MTARLLYSNCEKRAVTSGKIGVWPGVSHFLTRKWETPGQTPIFLSVPNFAFSVSFERGGAS